MAFVKRKFGHPGSAAPTPGQSFVPMAPGAVDSPQEPGRVPDRSTIPGEGELPVPIPEEGPRRPLSEYRTAQRIMGVYEKEGLDPLDPERFVQAPPSLEEQRKATPIQRTPLRPVPGYDLSVSGSRLTSGPDELEAELTQNQPTEPGQ